LSALVQSDPATAGAALRRILARKDECSVALRRRAVYIIGREGIGGGVPDLLEVAKNDPDIQVRTDAISRLAQMPGAAPALEQLFTSASDEAVQRSVLQAVRVVDGPEASRILRRAIEREDLPESVRVEAVRTFARGCCSREKPNENRLSEGDASYLRAAYEKNPSRNIKAAILETLARTGGPATDQWLLGIVKNGGEDIRYRSAALTRLQRSDVSVDELSKLYDALTERELRSTLVEILGAREEAAATDKLIDIARTGTDPTIRRRAIGMLARKKDPRTTKLLLELVEK
jgi:HEAT repeat protein